MIHHETFSGKHASETNGVGHFNVIENSDGDFIVSAGDGGMTLSEHDSLRGACAAARREAKEFDRQVRFSRQRKRAEALKVDMVAARKRAARLLAAHADMAVSAAEEAELRAVVAELLTAGNA